ncbi:MAG: threonylcarbamoyl-AMP synthase [Paludibacter sp.]|jgi:L-threonylcarbamoyladenylate synthase|nr:threonylcarbamoyl-AMP synthase [Paludibacter sp.]
MQLINKNSLSQAADCLRAGGLVAFPTETVYGLGANALDAVAVAKIFEAKKRPSFDPLIVHIAEKKQLETLFAHPIDPLVFRLADCFMPGPLTIVYKKADIIPSIVTSGLGNVAVRMPSHPVANELIRLAKVPVAAPSANLFGQLSPTSYRHVVKQKMEIDYLIAEDDCEQKAGIESTVVLVQQNKCIILRPGIITAADIKEKLPDVDVETASKNTEISSPGLLNSHYSPTKPLYFFDDNTKLPPSSGLILHRDTTLTFNAKRIIYSSHSGNLLETAANLFESLHQMEDDPQITQIYIQPTEKQGIGISIMDRLEKAAFRFLSEL